MRPKTDGIPLTFRQMLPVYLIVGIAVATMLNRSALPQSMRPEYWAAPGHEALDANPLLAGGFVTGQSRNIISLAGNDTLFVGDSITRRAPRSEVDVISLHGATVEAIAATFADQVAGRRYERIVLWPGTAYLSQSHDREGYVRNVMRMVDTAREHAREVVVVTPMPDRRVPDPGWVEYLNMVMPDRTERAGHEIHERLRAAMYADVSVYDAGAFRSRAILAGKFARMFEDPVHPNERGFRLIWQELSTRSSTIFEI